MIASRKRGIPLLVLIDVALHQADAQRRARRSSASPRSHARACPRRRRPPSSARPRRRRGDAIDAGADPAPARRPPSTRARRAPTGRRRRSRSPAARPAAPIACDDPSSAHGKPQPTRIDPQPLGRHPERRREPDAGDAEASDGPREQHAEQRGIDREVRGQQHARSAPRPRSAGRRTSVIVADDPVERAQKHDEAGDEAERREPQRGAGATASRARRR